MGGGVYSRTPVDSRGVPRTPGDCRGARRLTSARLIYPIKKLAKPMKMHAFRSQNVRRLLKPTKTNEKPLTKTLQPHTTNHLPKTIYNLPKPTPPSTTYNLPKPSKTTYNLPTEARWPTWLQRYTTLFGHEQASYSSKEHHI